MHFDRLEVLNPVNTSAYLVRGNPPNVALALFFLFLYRVCCTFQRCPFCLSLKVYLVEQGDLEASELFEVHVHQAKRALPGDSLQQLLKVPAVGQ